MCCFKFSVNVVTSSGGLVTAMSSFPASRYQLVLSVDPVASRQPERKCHGRRHNVVEESSLVTPPDIIDHSIT